MNIAHRSRFVPQNIMVFKYMRVHGRRVHGGNDATTPHKFFYVVLRTT